ncbi:MAG: Vps62-related protein [Chitinophagaceae bacterium]|nr:Vps62-related protein [Oligoflexus sp.]
MIKIPFLYALAFSIPLLATSCKSTSGRLADSTVSSAESDADERLTALAKRFAPQIQFHRDEKFFPISIEEFAIHTHIILDGREVLDSVLRGGSLPWNPDNYYVATREPLVGPNIPQDWMAGSDPRKGTAPMLYSIHDAGNNTYNIQYMPFFAWNEGKNVCYSLAPFDMCLIKRVMMGNHVGDWESFTIRVKDDKVVAIRLGAHEDRYTISDMSKIKFEGEHAVMYSARGSHGFYEKPANVTYQKIPTGDKLIDEATGGIPWFTWDNLVRVNENEGWAQYRGHWGNSVMGKAACDLTPIHIIDTLRKGWNPFGRLFGSKMETSAEVCKRLGLDKEFELGPGPWWQNWEKDKDGF